MRKVFVSAICFPLLFQIGCTSQKLANAESEGYINRGVAADDKATKDPLNSKFYVRFVESGKQPESQGGDDCNISIQELLNYTGHGAGRRYVCSENTFADKYSDIIYKLRGNKSVSGELTPEMLNMIVKDQKKNGGTLFIGYSGSTLEGLYNTLRVWRMHLISEEDELTMHNWLLSVVSSSASSVTLKYTHYPDSELYNGSSAKKSDDSFEFTVQLNFKPTKE